MDIDAFMYDDLYSKLMCTFFPILIIMFYHRGLVIKYGRDNYTYNDNMNIVYFEINGLKFGRWSLSHYVYYMYITLLFSYNKYYSLILFSIGCSWELIEDIISYYIKNKPINKKHTRRFNNQLDTVLYNNWWSGSINDIIVNSLGIMSGIIIHIYFNNIREYMCYFILFIYVYFLIKMAEWIKMYLPYCLLVICYVISWYYVFKNIKINILLTIYSMFLFSFKFIENNLKTQ